MLTKEGVQDTEVLPGDQVLVQQEKTDKLSTQFNPNPYSCKQAWEQFDCASPRKSPTLPQHCAC